MRNMTRVTDTLTGNLPSRDDVLRALGLRTSQSTIADFSSVLGVFGAGLLIGAGLALLFAPKSGDELRRDLSERMSSSREESSRMGGGVSAATSFQATSTPASAGL